MGAQAKGKSDRTAEGVGRIIDMMIAGTWRAATSPAAIASEFGVTGKTAQVWASEASRHITRSIGDPADIKARWLSQLEAVHGEARLEGEYGAAISAIGTAAKLTGMDKQGAPDVDWRTNPEWLRARSIILAALERHPEAMRDVLDAIAEAERAPVPELTE